MRKNTIFKALFMSVLWIWTGVFDCMSNTNVNYSTDKHVQQQVHTVKGVVSDQTGAIIGASVVVKGTQKGVISNLEGLTS